MEESLLSNEGDRKDIFYCSSEGKASTLAMSKKMNKDANESAKLGTFLFVLKHWRKDEQSRKQSLVLSSSKLF